MIADAVLALSLFAVLLAGLWLIGRGLARLAIAAIRVLDRRFANPVPNAWGDHPAWKGPGA